MVGRKYINYFLCVIFGILSFAYCGKSAPTYTKEEIDGIIRVKNFAVEETRGNDIQIKLVATLGGINSQDENEQFFEPRDIAFDKEENRYVLDRGNNRIQKFDRRGKYLATIGGEGHGPDELFQPQNIDISDNQAIYVGNSPGIKVFDLNGNYVKSFKLQSHDGNLRVLPSLDIALSNKIIGLSGPSTFKYKHLVSIFDSTQTLVNGIGEWKIRWETPGSFTAFVEASVEFDLDKNNNFLLSWTYQNRIEKLDANFEPVIRIERPLNFEITEGRLEGLRDILPNYVSRGIGVDHKNRIWILTFNRQLTDEEKKDKNISKIEGLFTLEVFSAEGILLKKIPFSRYCDRMVMHKDQIFFIDEYRTMAIYEYQIIE